MLLIQESLELELWSHRKGFIVSFDGLECPDMNINWYQLNTNAMKYSKIDLIMNAREV